MSLTIKELEDLQSLRGNLKKKSPKILLGYQKRFFMIVDGGKILTWFENENISSKPKGSIEIREIEAIKKVGSTDFEIKYGGRSFELRAESDSERELWINTLKKLQSYLTEQMIQDISTKNSARNKTMTTNKRASGRDDFWKEMDGETLKKIQYEKEKKIFEETKMLRKIENEDILKKKGLKKALDDIDKNILEKRLIMGFLFKKGQKQNTKFQKRWFILISSKPLYADSQLDEQIIKDTQLPLKIELNTLYYYKYAFEGDSSEFKGSISISDCFDVIKDDSKSEKEYIIKINMGERIFILAAESELERDRWVDALRTSIRNIKEMKNTTSGVIIKKNIDKAIDLYDKGGLTEIDKTETIRKYIDETYNNIVKGIIKDDLIEKTNDLEIFLKIEDNLNQELLDVIVACLAKDPKRVDIIKEYLDYFHENICDNLRKYWERNHSTISNFSILKMANWLQTFYKSISKYVDDKRIYKGITSLLNIYVNRVIENIETMIGGIIEIERKTQPSTNENGILVTTAPYDLFKLINEGFDMALRIIKTKEMGIKLAFYGKKVLLIYQHLMDSLIEDEEPEINQLIAISNNTIAFTTLTKEYAKRLVNDVELNEEEVENYFDAPKILKHFVSIGTNAKDKLLSFLFLNISCFFHCYFLELDLETLLTELIEKYKKTFSLLHDSFYRKVWKSFLDTLIVNYFHSFIFSCGKGKEGHREKFIEKLEKDAIFLENEFEGLIFVSLLEKTLKPFKNIIMLLKTSLFFCFEHFCLKLRENFGPAWNINTVRLILKIRRDLSSDYVKLIFLNIKQCISELELKEKNDVDKDETKTKIYEVFWDMVHDKAEETIKNDIKLGDVFKMEEKTAEEENEEKNSRVRTQTQFKKNSININMQDLDLRQISSSMEISMDKIQGRNRLKTENIKKIFTGEGYLMKKPPKSYKKFWEKRYFRLRNGVLFWYKNEQSTEAQNKIILSEAQDCFFFKDNIKFKISVNGQNYKFMSDNPTESDLWVTAIKKVINKQENEDKKEEDDDENGTIFEINAKDRKILFFDYDEENRHKKANEFITNRKIKEDKKINVGKKEEIKMEAMKITIEGGKNNNSENIEINKQENEEIPKKETTKKRGFWDSIFS